MKTCTAMLIVGGLAAALVPAIAAAQESPGIVCWFDDHGARACGDHVPAQYARKQRDIYDSRGVLRKSLQAELTPEQRAEQERRERDARQAQQAAQQQQANDSFMMQTYRSVAELKAARDVRLQLLDTRIQLGEKALNDGEAGMKELQDRADEALGAGKDAPPELQAQIRTYAAAQADNIRALTQMKQDRESTAAQFEHYIQRFQELHGTTSELPSPLSTPRAPATPGAPQPPGAPRPPGAPQPAAAPAPGGFR